MTRYILLLFVFIGLSAQAQKPWRAKLFAYFTDTAGQRIIDTVYVGCDTAAAEGFQAGLDVYGNDVAANTILCEDSILFIEEGVSCGILKTSIKGFNIGVVAFDLQLYGNYRKIDSIGWDTTDFLYADKFRLISAKLSTKDGYLDSKDNTENIFYNYYRSDSTRFEKITVSRIIMENPNYRCNVLFDDFRIRLTIRLAYFNTANEISKNNFKIYPNPLSSQELFIEHPQFDIKTIYLTDLTGRILNIQNNVGGDKTIFTLNNIPSGVYCVVLVDNVNNHFFKKITKL